MGHARKILIIGSGGQIGKALVKEFGSNGFGIGRNDLDLTNLDKIKSTLEKINPKAIINASAYTQVDKAEGERQLARTVNALAPGLIAEFCKSANIPLVHYSTDYVYSGDGENPFTEDQSTNPCNYYGETKLEGDSKIIAAGANHLILRTCWVYDASGKNFFNTILRLAGEREELSIVGDQVGSPSFAGDLANGTKRAFELAQMKPKFPSGIYHLRNSGFTTWYDFAEEIIEGARESGVTLKVKKIKKISSEEYKSAARRPKNSRLSTAKIESILGIAMPSWSDGLSRCVREKFS